MIGRLWRGWTTPRNAPLYEAVVRGEVIPGIEAMGVPGFRRIDLLRRPGPHEGRVEFATIMWFDRLEDVRAFVGDDVDAVHVPAAARAVLADFDRRAVHFDLVDRRDQPTAPAPAAPPRDVPPDAALVLIDLQEGFRDGSWGPRNNPGAEEAAARLLDAWRRAGRPAHHVHHASRAPDGRFRRGTPGFEPLAATAPAPGEPRHVKEVNSAFIGTELEARLRGAGVTCLALVGLTTNHCVSTTARMAANLGFRTLVVSDATAAHASASYAGRWRSAEEVHEGALGDLAGEFAEILSSADLTAAVDGSLRG